MGKYNAKKTIVDGIEFDSKLESEYYLLLKQLQQEGKVKEFTLQPFFTLQAGFHKNGKFIRPIVYKADFEIEYANGYKEIVDVKGFETTDFKIKKKLFESRYPHLTLTLVKYVKKYGGWINVECWKELKRNEKKVKP